jgi:hypothetical protein
VIPGLVVAASLAQTGQRMAVFGLLLGGLAYATTRPGSRPSKGAYGRGQDRVARALAIPLLAIGVCGLILWGASALRG